MNHHQWTARRRAGGGGGNHHQYEGNGNSNSNSSNNNAAGATATTTTTVTSSSSSSSPGRPAAAAAVAATVVSPHHHHGGVYDNRTSKGRPFSVGSLLGRIITTRPGSQGRVTIFVGILALAGMTILLLMMMMMMTSGSDRSLRWRDRENGQQQEQQQPIQQNRQHEEEEVLPLSSSERTTKVDGSIRPVLLKGIWTRPTKWDTDELMGRVGHYPQYVKDVTVQPYRRRNRDQRRTKNDGGGEGEKNTVMGKGDNTKEGEFCILPGIEIANLLTQRDDVLFFTNNKENEGFMSVLRGDYAVPEEVQHITGFEVFSALGMYQSHSFHAHGESWLGQVEGRRMWWFVPPTEPAPPRVNACRYLDDASVPLPRGAVSFLQNPGDVMWFPKDWYHATCALDGWTVGIGRQQGRTIRQRFPKLPPPPKAATGGGAGSVIDPMETAAITDECLSPNNNTKKNNNMVTIRQKKSATQMATPVGATSTSSSSIATAGGTVKVGSGPAPKTQAANGKDGWKWFDGDLNAYYNSLEKDEQRDPNNVGSYAIHRWLGPNRTTEEHYRLVYSTAERYHPSPGSNLTVLDGGCGLGSGLMWMEGRAPQWNLTGYTISDEQYKFITESLPPHKFVARLQSYNDLDVGSRYNFIYSIEALIHSDDIERTLQIWTEHLAPGGIITLIDDFLAAGEDRSTEDMQNFAKSWLANSLVTIDELRAMTDRLGLDVVENRDLLAEYNIVQVNYKNKKPVIQPFGGRTHQGWMGSKWRQRLTVEGRLLYNMVVLTKKPNSSQCAAVPFDEDSDDEGDDDKAPNFVPQTLMTGRGKDGGQPMTCISGWYCCDKGTEWYDNMTVKRTEKKVDYLHLDRNLFGHYMEVFPRHLNLQYDRYIPNAGGRFLDIGGTGSTSVGMTQVLSKFQHFAGPLEYWKLDSDPAAKTLDRTLFCDVENCPEAETCGFDVTFSHTVLEHAARPWLAFDTIARITKKGGLTMHLVPWSYQYHATPDDNFRFSHTALKTMLEDRGFDVLEVGYDLCTKQEKMLKKVDEHYDVIWLTYVVGRKK